LSPDESQSGWGRQPGDPCEEDGEHHWGRIVWVFGDTRILLSPENIIDRSLVFLMHLTSGYEVNQLMLLEDLFVSPETNKSNSIHTVKPISKGR